MTRISLPDLRQDYKLRVLRRKDLLADPILQFRKWFEEATDAQALEPNAMALATVNQQNEPSIRTVLLKGLDARGFVFFTNYESRKGRDLLGNAKAALLFHWSELERQVSVRGVVAQVSREESEIYFASRPAGSKLAAWASSQSTVIPDRAFLEKKLAEVAEKFAGKEIPAPPFWGGYVLAPATMEFWQGGGSRLHDRFLYTRQDGNEWRLERLSP